MGFPTHKLYHRYWVRIHALRYLLIFRLLVPCLKSSSPENGNLRSLNSAFYLTRFRETWKFEARNPKYETISKRQCPKSKTNRNQSRFCCLGQSYRKLMRQNTTLMETKVERFRIQRPEAALNFEPGTDQFRADVRLQSKEEHGRNSEIYPFLLFFCRSGLRTD